MNKEVIEKLTALITAAFGLVAALAWNEAIASLFKPGGALEELSAFGPWVYALLVTIIAVTATIWMSRWEKGAKTRIDARREKKRKSN